MATPVGISPNVAEWMLGIERRLEAIEQRLEAFESAKSFKAGQTAAADVSADPPDETEADPPPAQTSAAGGPSVRVSSSAPTDKKR